MQTLETRRPFTRADAIAAGISPKELRGSKFRRIFYGVYIAARVPDHPLIRTQAALIVHPADAFASHFTAGRVYGVPLPVHALEHVTVSKKSDRTERDGIQCHVSTPGFGGVTVVDGVRVSSACAMFIELASYLTLVDLVVVGDALVRLKRVSSDQLRAFCDASDARFARAAQRAAAYVRAKVDSPMETRLRMLIILAGLPEPEVNHEIRDDFGNVIMCFDLSYPGIKLIIEYDGRQHAKNTKQWLHDVKRRERLDETGWRIVIVTSEGIYRKPAETISRVWRALQQRGRSGLQTKTTDAWRPFFPAR